MDAPATQHHARTTRRVFMRPSLRVLTCGSVDDGKSSLIGRLLYEEALIYEDQFAAIKRDSKKFGTVGDDIDFALLLDGLEAEREQGITIDVAYRYFSTARRSFIVADTPGHEQYTRNMVTGASNADLAVILVDARKGLLSQTFRHSIIASLLGIRHVVLAVNKIDLIAFDQTIFQRIAASFAAFAGKLDFRSVTPIPVSARFGDNVSSISPRTPWYDGPHLIDLLENIEVEDSADSRPFRMAVQWINRPHLDFRGLSGRLASGTVQGGDSILIAGSDRVSKINRIIGPGGEMAQARSGDSVTLLLEDDLDIARGDLLSDRDRPPQVADQFAAHLIWLAEDPLLPGRSYLLKIGSRTLPAAVTEIKHRLDVNNLDKLAAKTLALNEVGFCNVVTSAAIAFDPYSQNRETGGFILIDRYSNATAAAGIISFGLRRAVNIHHQELTIDKRARAKLKHQRPGLIWFTGLSGAGKSTIANLVESQLHESGAHTALLDGDNVRHGLTKDLGFTDADRVENIRRAGEVAKLMTEAGLIVLCAFISPFRSERRMVRDLFEPDEFIEIFVDTPLDECIARDPKGLYRRARAGEIKNFTGVDQVYERPEHPDLQLMAGQHAAEVLAQQVVDLILKKGFLHDVIKS